MKQESVDIRRADEAQALSAGVSRVCDLWSDLARG